jgi:hypothetical protein
MVLKKPPTQTEDIVGNQERRKRDARISCIVSTGRSWILMAVEKKTT